MESCNEAEIHADWSTSIPNNDIDPAHYLERGVVSASSEWKRYPHDGSIPSTPTSSETQSKYVHNSKQNSTRPPRHWLCGNVVVVEIVTFLYMLSFQTQLPVAQYYIIDRIWTANPDYPKSKVLDKTAGINIYLSLSMALVAVVPTIFYGVLCDRFGRKLVMLISLTGSLAKSIAFFLVIHFETRIDFLYIAYALDGISGSIGTFLMGMFGMVSDITTPGKKRDIRTTVVTAAIFSASAAGVTSSGFWTRYVGYAAPVIFSGSVVALGILLVLFVIPETISAENKTDHVSVQVFLRFIRIFTSGSSSSVRRILLISLFAFFAANYDLQANNNTIILYLEGSPFSWPDDKIALYSGVYTLTGWIAILIVSKLFHHSVRDVTFASIATLTSTIGFVIQGLAYNDAMIYSAAVISLLASHSIPMMRAIMSRHTPASQQGSLFSGVAVLEMMTGTVAGVSAPYLYKLGLYHYYGLQAFVFGGIAFISFIAVMILRYSLARNESLHGRQIMSQNGAGIQD